MTNDSVGPILGPLGEDAHRRPIGIASGVAGPPVHLIGILPAVVSFTCRSGSPFLVR